jgi:hypothetical protein
MRKFAKGHDKIAYIPGGARAAMSHRAVGSLGSGRVEGSCSTGPTPPLTDVRCAQSWNLFSTKTQLKKPQIADEESEMMNIFQA